MAVYSACPRLVPVIALLLLAAARAHALRAGLRQVSRRVSSFSVPGTVGEAAAQGTHHFTGANPGEVASGSEDAGSPNFIPRTARRPGKPHESPKIRRLGGALLPHAFVATKGHPADTSATRKARLIQVPRMARGPRMGLAKKAA